VTEEALSIRVHVENEKVIVIAPVGEIDAFNAFRMREVVAELLSYEPPAVTIDLALASFIDAAGLRVLIDAGGQLYVHGGQLTIRGTSQSQRLALHLLEGDKVARVVP
jgi:anti-anti-sigma factor